MLKYIFPQQEITNFIYRIKLKSIDKKKESTFNLHKEGKSQTETTYCIINMFYLLPVTMATTLQYIMTTKSTIYLIYQWEHYNILLPVKTNFGAILYLKLVDEIHNNMTGDTSGVRTPYHSRAP